MKIIAFALLLSGLIPVSALEIGDPAPPLHIAEWIKGDEIDLETDDKVYVVEFWATWCPPCRFTIPHLTDLQQRLRHRGVVFVSISNEDSATVKPFVEEMGVQMNYTVALDDANQTTQNYLGGFGVGGMPHAFVINKQGRVVWHGHPRGSLGEVLNLVLAGQFDPDTVPTMDTGLEKAREYLAGARQGKSKVELATIGPSVIRESSHNVDLLNHFAWSILTDPRVKTRDTALALEAAQAANEATEASHPAILDTYARALFESGEKEKAVEIQKKALELTADKRLTAKLEASLARYTEVTP